MFQDSLIQKKNKCTTSALSSQKNWLAFICKGRILVAFYGEAIFFFMDKKKGKFLVL